MPALGLGVFQTPPDETRHAVRAAWPPGTGTSTPPRLMATSARSAKQCTLRSWTGQRCSAGGGITDAAGAGDERHRAMECGDVHAAPPSVKASEEDRSRWASICCWRSASFSSASAHTRRDRLVRTARAIPAERGGNPIPQRAALARGLPSSVVTASIVRIVSCRHCPPGNPPRDAIPAEQELCGRAAPQRPCPPTAGRSPARAEDRRFSPDAAAPWLAGPLPTVEWGCSGPPRA